MIYIIVYHCFCYYDIWALVFPDAPHSDYSHFWFAICQLILSVFVFISGFLFETNSYKYKDQSRLKTIIPKVNRLLLPYLIWSVICIELFPGISQYGDILLGVQHLWFLNMLFLTFVFVVLIRNILQKTSMCVIVLVSIVLINSLVSKYFSHHWIYGYYQWLFSRLPDLLAGILVARLKVFSGLKSISALWSTVFFIIMSSIVGLPVFNISLPLLSIYYKYLIYIWIVSFYLILNHWKTESNSFIKTFDRNSMGIYIIHHILIYAILIYIPGFQTLMDNHFFLGPLILFATVFPLSILIANVLGSHRTTSLLFNTRIDRDSLKNILRFIPGLRRESSL